MKTLENKKFKVGNDAFLEAKKNNYKYMGWIQLQDLQLLQQ